MDAEISYDLVMDDDMSFVEGTFRFPGEAWQVFIFSKWNRSEVVSKPGNWKIAVKGITFYVPRETKLSMGSVEAMLGEALGVECWTRVRGPDSMGLR